MNKKLEKIYAYHNWRQSIDLGEGLKTPGFINKTLWNSIKLPENLNGKTFLDVGANDGLLSFLAESKGAKEIVASDLYKDMSETMKDGWSQIGINLLREYFDSRVELHKHGVYHLTEMGKKFDVVVVNNVIVWLTDVELAIKQLAEVTGGTLYLADGFLIDNSAPRRITPTGASMRFMYNVKYISNLLEKYGFKIESVVSFNTQNAFVRNFIELPNISITTQTKIYRLPNLASEYVDGKSVTTQANLVFEDFFHLAELGWVNRNEVKVAYFKPSLLYRLAKSLGMMNWYYNFLQNKHVKQYGNTAFMIKAIK